MLDRVLVSSTVIVAAFALTQVTACGKNKSSNSRAPSGEEQGNTPGGPAGPGGSGDGGEGGAEGGEDGEGGGQAESRYEAKGGDLNKLTLKTKTWISGQTEPEWTDGPGTDSEVLALYKEGLRCKYRLKSTINGVSSVADVGCEAVQCGGSTCETRDIEAQDVGDFLAAAGKETKCSQVVETAGQRTLVTSVSSTWTHKDALREGQVVKSDSVSCTLVLNAGEEPGSLDACNPPAGRTAQKTRAEQVLTAQTRGEGTANLENEANFSFKVAGSFADKEGAKAAMTTCNMAAGTFYISMSKAYCTAANKLDYYSLTFNSLPTQSTDDHPTSAYGVNLYAETKSYLGTNAGACNISYTADQASNVLTGTASCGADALSVMGGGGSVSVSDVKFSCFAPEGFFD